MYCTKCGNLITEGSSFCSKCGERVEAKTEQNISMTSVTQSKNMSNDKYAVLSVVLPVVMFIVWIFFSLPFLLMILVLSMSFEFSRKGLNSSKNLLAKIGKILNIVLGVLLIVFWILQVISLGGN